jgi:phosphate-selective porin OprO and OprP
MKSAYIIILLLLIGYQSVGQDKKNFDVYWNNGLKADSHDGSFKIKMGGRLQYDVMWINQDDSLNNHFDAYNGTEFRRARLYTSGKIYNNIKFKFQMDFADGNAIIKDAYIQLTKIPYVGNLRVGNFKEPFGLSMLTSSKYITFMERPLANAFDNDRNPGFMAFNQHLEKRLSWYAGYFFPTDNSGKYLGNKYNVVFRLTGLPLYDVDNGYKVLHLGMSYAHQYHDNTEVKFSLRPEAHLAPKYLSLKMDDVSNINDINAEFLLIYNSFSIESEYTISYVLPGDASTLSNSSYNFSAYTATLSWFITGEHKNYVQPKTAYDRVTPRKNFGDDGGIGAFELAFRYSYMDLDDADLAGGIMSNITGGINWYLNPSVKVATNYVYSDVKDLGKANIFQMRFQIAF